MDPPHQDPSSIQIMPKIKTNYGLNQKSQASVSPLIYLSPSKKDSNGRASTGLKTMINYLQ